MNELTCDEVRELAAELAVDAARRRPARRRAGPPRPLPGCRQAVDDLSVRR